MSSNSRRIEGTLLLNIAPFRNSINEAISLLNKLSNTNLDKISQKHKANMDKIAKDTKNASDSSTKDLQKINTVDFNKLETAFKAVSNKIGSDAVTTSKVAVDNLQKIANNPNFSNLNVKFKSVSDGISSDAILAANIAVSKLQEITQVDFKDISIKFKSVTDQMGVDSKKATNSILSDLQNIDSGLNGMLMGEGAALGMDKLFKEAYARASMMWRLNNRNAKEAKAILQAYTEYDISSARPDHDLVKMMEWIINSGKITAANTKKSLAILDAISANADPIRERGAMFAYSRYLGSGYDAAKMAFRDEGLSESQLSMLEKATTYEERLNALKQLGIERGSIQIGQNGEIIGQYNTMQGEIGGYNQALALLDVVVQSATLSFMGLMDFLKPSFEWISKFAESNQDLIGGLVVSAGGLGLLTGGLSVLNALGSGTIGFARGLGKGLLFLEKQMQGTVIQTRILTPLLERLNIITNNGGVAGGTKGGKNSGGKKTGSGTSKGAGGLNVGSITGNLKAVATGTVTAAAAIAAAMVLATEAIYLLQAPMWAVGELGRSYKSNKVNIGAGVEAFKIVGSVVAMVLPPIVAFVFIMGVTGSSAIVPLAVGAVGAAAGIAIAMGLVTEAVYLLQAPLWALSELGGDFKDSMVNVELGLEAIKMVGDALTVSTPILLMFVGATALFVGTGVVGGLYVAVAASVAIAASVGLVTQAIVELKEPLRKMGELGGEFQNLDQVKNGVEAIRRASEAISYISQIKVDISTSAVADAVTWLVEMFTGVNTSSLDKLTEENGVLTKIREFTVKFNEQVTGITEINVDAVNSLKGALTSIQTVRSILDNVGQMYDFNKQGAQDIGSFLQIKLDDIIKNIKIISTHFITPFSQITIGSVDSEKVEALKSVVNVIKEVSNTVNAVKSAVQGIGDAYNAWNSNRKLDKQIEGWGGDKTLQGPLNQLYDSLVNIVDFINRVKSITTATLTNEEAIKLMTESVTSIINAVKTTTSGLKGKIEGAIGDVNVYKIIKDKLLSGSVDTSGLNSTLNSIVSTITGKAGAAKNAGQKLGSDVNTGFKLGLAGITGAVNSELGAVLKILDGKKKEFYDKGVALGQAVTSGYRDGSDISSPGLMARDTLAETNYVLQYLTDSVNPAYLAAQNLGQNISAGFGSPSLEVGDTEGLNQAQSNAKTALSMVQNTANVTTRTFTGVDSTLQGSFASMALNANKTFSNVNASSTLQMKDMASKTSNEIGNIRSSWMYMQDALINSASTIRTQTGNHINRLQSNMAGFWRKVRNPVLLLGGGYAGSPSAGRKVSGGGYAGGNSLVDKKLTGNKGLKLLNDPVSLPCFDESGLCYAGWNFNWTSPVKNSIGKWSTNFGHVYDPYLSVGKFEHSNFPVKGNAQIFKAFILDAIGRTQYQYYYNSKGGSPASIYNSGSFNCWDGYRIVEGFANAFGLPCHMERGMWGSDRHVWANVGGVGRVDATAIQKSGGTSLFNSKVRAAGPAPKPDEFVTKKITNKNDIKIELSLQLPNVTNQEELLEGLDDKVESIFYKIFNNEINGE